MINKTTSCKLVIAKIYRDLGLNDPNYEYDMIEWIGEALDFIGAGVQFETKISTIQVENFKGLLPVGLVVINQLRYDDKYIKYNPSSFKGQIDNSPNHYANTEETYTLNPNFIVTTFEEGEVEISYKAVAVDEDGYPLVPDNQYYREALFWYCLKQMLLKGYQPKMEQMTYEFAMQQWKFYCTAARNKANYPDIGGYERFKEIWTGLIPNNRSFEIGYDLRDVPPNEMDVVTASNLVTRPLTVEIPNEN